MYRWYNRADNMSIKKNEINRNTSLFNQGQRIEAQDSKDGWMSINHGFIYDNDTDRINSFRVKEVTNIRC